MGGNGKTVQLSTGVYVFKGGVSVAGSGGLLTSAGANVLIYMTCASTPCSSAGATTAAPFLTQGDSGLNLTGHPSYEGIAIFVDRAITRNPCVRIAGTGVLAMNGGIYGIKCRVEIEGGGSGDVAIDGSIIADTIGFRGEATYTVSASVTSLVLSNESLIE
jgi:hypothetical protein